MSTYQPEGGQEMTDRQLFPSLDAATEAALTASIERWGVLVPVVVDQHGAVIDGHHRSAIAESLGVEYARLVRHVEDEEEALELARTLNTDRRHLTPEQRKEQVGFLREAGHSTPAIARAVGASQSQVDRDVAELTRAGKLTPPETVRGLDGKVRPAQRPQVLVNNEAEQEKAQQALQTRSDKLPTTGTLSLRETRPGAHVGNNAGDNEWYTPAEYIDAARKVMGSIDLDPASSAVANEIVGATTFYTEADNGLTREWAGNVWMNPPYARPLIDQFAAKLADSYSTGEVEQACVLVNNATDTGWFHALADVASAICFTRGRVKFWAPDKQAAPLQGQAVIYLGPHVEDFRTRFVEFGFTVAL